MVYTYRWGHLLQSRHDSSVVVGARRRESDQASNVPRRVFPAHADTSSLKPQGLMVEGGMFVVVTLIRRH